MLSYGVLNVQMSAAAPLKSGVYHLLPTCHVYIDIRLTLSASGCRDISLKAACTCSCVTKDRNRISVFKFEIWKLREMRREQKSDLSPRGRRRGRYRLLSNCTEMQNRQNNFSRVRGRI